MRTRFSTALGLPVIDDDTGEPLGALNGILLNPDTGKVEGFFIKIPGFLSSTMLFLSSFDVLHWGMRVAIRGMEVLSPLEDHIRLQTMADEGRYFLGQRIVTDTGRYLGVCKDVQFDTDQFMVEWFWPKKFWKWQSPLPLTQIQEVRKEAIIVRDPSIRLAEKTSIKTSLINQLPDAA